MAYRSPPSRIIVLWKALYQTGEGMAFYRPLCSVLYSSGGRLCNVLWGSSLPSPVFGFIQQGETAIYRSLCTVLYGGGGAVLCRPLCSVLYSRGGRLSTVPCVRLYIAEGRLSITPCVRLYVAGEAALYSKLCFCTGVSMAFEGGNGVRYIPPPAPC